MQEIDNIILEILEETIRKRKNKYCLISGSGRNLGCYRSKSGAAKREKQVNYFKHKKKKIKKEDGAGAVAGYAVPIGAPLKRKDNE